VPKDDIRIAIAYHSRKGHTAVIAEAVAAGARSLDGVDVRIIDVAGGEVPWQALFDADGIVFGSPTHFGSVSAEMKAFLDATDAFWGAMRWRDKIAAGFTCGGEPSGGDKGSVLQTFATFAAQHGMVWVGMDPMNDVRTGEGKPAGYNSHGGYLGAMADSDGGAVTPDSPPEPHRVTAEVFGRRVARATMRWVRGPSTDGKKRADGAPA
jgi:multimeric flavodoxin WrbA